MFISSRSSGLRLEKNGQPCFCSLTTKELRMPISLPDSIDDSLFDDFFNEFSEAYHFCEVKLVELERTPENQDLVNQIFRAVHTVKGNFSFVGLSALTPLLQATEDILGAVREGSCALITI